MKLQTALKKLTAAGFIIDTNGALYTASRREDFVHIRFICNDGENVRSNGFSYDAPASCAPTFGLTLKGALA